MNIRIKRLVAVAAAGLALLLAQYVRAAVFVLAGSGPTINANSTTNFTALAPVGTFQLFPQNIYLSTGYPVTATNGLTVYGRLTFDGTNFFTIAQSYSNPVTNAALNSVLWTITNTVYQVYGTLSVSNGTPVNITNFQAQLQY